MSSVFEEILVLSQSFAPLRVPGRCVRFFEYGQLPCFALNSGKLGLLAMGSSWGFSVLLRAPRLVARYLSYVALHGSLNVSTSDHKVADFFIPASWPMVCASPLPCTILIGVALKTP